MKKMGVFDKFLFNFSVRDDFNFCEQIGFLLQIRSPKTLIKVLLF